jgi:hypothetical protein
MLTPIFTLHLFPNMLVVSLLYLDPGSGSFIIQLLLATLVGGLMLVKIYYKKIKEFFSKISNRHLVSKDDDKTGQ